MTQRQILVASLVAIWSVRLGTHIVRRNLQRTDDPRYAKMAMNWCAAAPCNFFWLLQKQAWCGAILVVAVWAAAHRPAVELNAADWLGVAILVIAIVGEAIADRQLQVFASTPENQGRVCDTGLWRYSRHPNYFFEWLGWLAYPVIAIDVSGVYPWGWLALAAPALMYWLLVYVSGIPPLEEQMVASRGAAYRAYCVRTNAFFPDPIKAVRQP